MKKEIQVTREEFEAMVARICDEYCKYPSQVAKAVSGDDAPYVLESICDLCPLNELMEAVNNA